jgi:hypothetical protein
MLNDIEVLDRPDPNFWMASAYLIPDTPGADVKPGQTGFKTVPINRMVPRSFVTNLIDGASVQPGARIALRGIAFGGDRGVGRVDVSTDQGEIWQDTTLGPDEGSYGFRQWRTDVVAPGSGAVEVMARCTNSAGLAQPAAANWNGGGFMRNVIESLRLVVA